ncbi:MAG TPA: hypothetical protein VL992_05640 [Tepidisphaeraceae bacterium]|nr:hypothetical protein [Tepidisphaeraceae bacterium]
MSRQNIRWLGVAVASALLTGLVAFPLGMRSAQADDMHNPRIHHAIEALHAAEDELNEAPHDFHGHKQDAIDAIHHAIRELDRIKDW